MDADIAIKELSNPGLEDFSFRIQIKGYFKRFATAQKAQGETVDPF